jgi:hypothetical protein
LKIKVQEYIREDALLGKKRTDGLFFCPIRGECLPNEVNLPQKPTIPPRGKELMLSGCNI